MFALLRGALPSVWACVPRCISCLAIFQCNGLVLPVSVHRSSSQLHYQRQGDPKKLYTLLHTSEHYQAHLK